VVVMFGGAVLTSPAMADAGPVVVSECSGHCVTDVGGVATVVVKK
jgi:hypothetical protein